MDVDSCVIINKIHKFECLQSLVRQELKELGVKLPKLKKLKKISQARNSSLAQDDVSSNTIFGEYLQLVPCIVLPEYGLVPQFLIDAVKVIDKHIEMEGIFRKSGSVSRQKQLQLKIEARKSIEAANIYDIAALIKQFFRELPEPVFVQIYHESFIKCFNLPVEKDPKSALLSLCLLLPLEHIGALRFTLHMLDRVASSSRSNKMTTNNLALVMAPNMMHLGKLGSGKMSAEEERMLHVQACIIELLIKNWRLVGLVSPTLQQQLNMMSECFVTDDELDASDDNTLEDSKDVCRRKKRKRSSSLTGFVNSIAHGIAKLRRSTDGKTLIATNSNSATELSVASKDLSELSRDVEVSVSSLTRDIETSGATPCVVERRSRRTENTAFSTSKKKAILNSLPQKSALASTPYTPCTSVKKGLRSYHVAETATTCLNSTTPAISSCKTTRKKLNLFGTPSSSKIKRQSSAYAKMDSPPTVEKPTKSKSFFRRLSGPRTKKVVELDLLETILPPPPGFGDNSVMEDPPQLSSAPVVFFSNQADEEIEVNVDLDDEDEDVDVESLSGFSVISGGTVMRRTDSGTYLGQETRSGFGTSITNFMAHMSDLAHSTKTLKAAVSNDSLLSVGSRMSDHSGRSEPSLKRCISTDSGKGSMLDENSAIRTEHLTSYLAA